MLRAGCLFDFPDLFSQVRGVRQDTTVIRTEAKEFGAASGSPAGAPRAGTAVEIRGLRHSYGELTTLAGVDLEVPHAGVLGLVGPSGCGKSTLLELVCGLREPSAGVLEVYGARDATSRLASCAFMPQRDVLLPWLSALDNAALAPRPPSPGANRGGGAVRALRPRRLRARPAEGALGRDAPAGRLPANPALAQAGAGARRAVRLARRDHAGRDAGLARERARRRPPHRRPRHPRRRGGPLSRRPRRRPLGSAGPGRRRAGGPGAARRRPRRRRHRPPVRRSSRAGDGGTARGDAMKPPWRLSRDMDGKSANGR